MVGPTVVTRMKQRSYLTRHWIDPCQIWPLVKIAAMARQRQIPRVVHAAMLLRNDVFNVVEQLTILLRQPAIFAPRSGPLANESSRFSIHRYLVIWPK